MVAHAGPFVADAKLHQAQLPAAAAAHQKARRRAAKSAARHRNLANAAVRGAKEAKRAVRSVADRRAHQRKAAVVDAVAKDSKDIAVANADPAVNRRGQE